MGDDPMIAQQNLAAAGRATQDARPQLQQVPSRSARVSFVDSGGDSVVEQIIPEDAAEIVNYLCWVWPVATGRPLWVRLLITLFGRIEELAPKGEVTQRCRHGHLLGQGKVQTDGRCKECDAVYAKKWAAAYFREHGESPSQAYRRRKREERMAAGPHDEAD